MDAFLFDHIIYLIIHDLDNLSDNNCISSLMLGGISGEAQETSNFNGMSLPGHIIT
jgi:hypothetical protein